MVYSQRTDLFHYCEWAKVASLGLGVLCCFKVFLFLLLFSTRSLDVTASHAIVKLYNVLSGQEPHPKALFSVHIKSNWTDVFFLFHIPKPVRDAIVYLLILASITFFQHIGNAAAEQEHESEDTMSTISERSPMGLSQNSEENREEVAEEGVWTKLKLFVNMFSRW